MHVLHFWTLKHSKYDGGFLPLVTLVASLTTWDLFDSFQRILLVYRVECITVSGFLNEKWNKRQREIQICIFSARHRGRLNFILQKSSASYRVTQFAGITFSQKQPSFLWTQCQCTLYIGQSCHSFMQIRWQQSELWMQERLESKTQRLWNFIIE